MCDRWNASVLLAVLWALVAGCTINLNLWPTPGPLREEEIGGTGSAKVLLMEVSGLISSVDGDAFIGGDTSQVSRVKEELGLAAQDQKIKAIVLRINSPGGTVTASDIIYHELRTFKEKRNIPIIASIMDVGASGGYYVAAAADEIVAHPSSVTGSLGVIMLTVNAHGLLEKIGVQATAVTSGPKKDMGSPFRPMTPEERAIFQDVINSFYNQFLTVIQKSRTSLTAAQIRTLADGRIYSGEQAKTLGLVDGVGYLDDAIELAKKEVGLREARIVTYHRPGEYRPNIYARSFGGGFPGLSNFDLMHLVRGGTPQFMYLWMP